MPVESPHEMIALLERSQLLSEERLAEARELVEQGKTPLSAADLIEWLVLLGDVTAWQAERLLEGTCIFHVGKYKLLSQIGQGGMGAVFKAEHAVMGRIVALKILFKARLDNPTALARFRREVKALAALNHSNIVTAHDAGQIADVHYLVMEFVDGMDLSAWCKRYGKLPIPLACEFIRQAALGLEHAARQGLVHRDIKPANLLVHWANRELPPVVKLLDLGLARFHRDANDEELQDPASRHGGMHSDDGLTLHGHILGTPDYLSPEQILGSRVDIRSDIFSLGCTLCKLLTGVIPFGGKHVVEKLQARSAPNAPPAIALRQLLPDAPVELEAIMAKMLARDPDDRFETPADVAIALVPFSLVRSTKWDRKATTETLFDTTAEFADDAEDDATDGYGWLDRLAGDTQSILDFPKPDAKHERPVDPLPTAAVAGEDSPVDLPQTTATVTARTAVASPRKSRPPAATATTTAVSTRTTSTTVTPSTVAGASDTAAVGYDATPRVQPFVAGPQSVAVAGADPALAVDDDDDYIPLHRRPLRLLAIFALALGATVGVGWLSVLASSPAPIVQPAPTSDQASQSTIESAASLPRSWSSRLWP